jgi:pre-mRNA-processing factor SLU7
MGDKAPSVDQDGKIINPHNPEFITKVPWYLGNHGPTLKHHTIQKNDHLLSIGETDSIISQKLLAQQKSHESKSRTLFKKGCCRNCGASTHQDKDCLERPRSSKKSAWKTGVVIAADDVVVDFSKHGKLSYDAKRDNWQGYDPAEYNDVIERHERMEADKNQNAVASNDVIGGDKTGQNNESKEDYVYRDEDVRDFQGTIIPQGGVGGAGMRVTVRNLRLREDTPKYLRNLSLDSAFYDPKSRSMRSNPYPNANPEDVPYAGDNFLRYTGDAVKLAQNQVLCWEMQARGESVDILSNPSQAEILQKLHKTKKEEQLALKKDELLTKYGTGGVKESDPRLLLGQSEHYVEFNLDGKVAASEIKIHSTVVTKYCEDEHPLNHTSVWGSYYDRGSASWGYQCCHCTLKNSYCVGKPHINSKIQAQPLKRGFSEMST